MREKSGKHIKISGLDGLRGIAIILVLLYHFFPNAVKGGYIGVPLFFILSGYLMARLSKQRWEVGKFNVRQFYSARFWRIYPSLLVVVGLVSYVSFFIMPRLLNGMTSELLSIFGSYNNQWQISQNSNYFDRISNASPFTHMWSLAIEVQFYVLWPILFIGYKKIKPYMSSAHWFFLFLTVCSMNLMTIQYLMGTDISVLYYSTLTRFSGVLLGVWIGLQSPRVWQNIANRLNSGTVYGLFIVSWVIVLFFSFVAEGQSPWLYLTNFSLMTFLLGVLLILSTLSNYPFGKWLDFPIFRWFGTRSYELYLWHYSLIFMVKSLKFSWNTTTIIITVLLTFLLSELLHFFVFKKMGSMANIRNEVRMKSGLAGAIIGLAIVSSLGIVLAFVGDINTVDSKDNLKETLEANAALLQNQSVVEQTTTVMEVETVSTVEGETTSVTESTTTVLDVSQLPMTLVGDSVMLGASQSIKELLPNSYINAVESRQAYAMAGELQQMIYNGQVADTVVIALGTNGYFAKEYGQELIDILGSNRTIFWVNVYGEFLQWETDTNAVINQLVAENENVHLIDWELAVSQHPEWLISDGIHPNVEGMDAYAQVLFNTIQSVLE
ncbi:MULTISPECIES: acyltransferase family protein [unclassified Facklamia]|uniref:acyltransferase family protein n=1 Tax=Aerococcaceae TaxID=186827 RepID=UPI0013B677EE|nr:MULTISPECIES: acyltransferase family protein [unclassified Facklamia]NEW63703.1 acyltransferase family protein [Facklamia sp. 252]NEW67174.1 acyltransferase family protein [Facklamia sp. 253]QQD66286.1 acyltransferase [Aerococcaceae bacterium zg-252]